MRRFIAPLCATLLLVASCKKAASDAKSDAPVSDVAHVQRFVDLLENLSCPGQKVLYREADKKVVQSFSGEDNVRNSDACRLSYLYMYYLVEKSDAEAVYDPFRTPKEALAYSYGQLPCVKSVVMDQEGFVVTVKEGEYASACASGTMKAQILSETQFQLPYRWEVSCEDSQGANRAVFVKDVAKDNSVEAGLSGFNSLTANVNGENFAWDHCEVASAEEAGGLYAVKCFDPAQGDQAPQPRFLVAPREGGLLATFHRRNEDRTVELLCRF